MFNSYSDKFSSITCNLRKSDFQCFAKFRHFFTSFGITQKLNFFTKCLQLQINKHHLVNNKHKSKLIALLQLHSIPPTQHSLYITTVTCINTDNRKPEPQLTVSFQPCNLINLHQVTTFPFHTNIVSAVTHTTSVQSTHTCSILSCPKTETRLS